jgi:hypothetical protein
MKRNFKVVIPPTATPHLKSLNTKKTMINVIGIPNHGLGQAYKTWTG